MSQPPNPSSGSAAYRTDERKDLAVIPVCCNACMGCVEAAPEFFAYDEATDAVVILRDRATEDDVREALNACPKDCIILE